MPLSAFMTELEAVNVLLSVADEAPAQALEVPGLLPLAQARQCLLETTRVVQSMGWKFNTDYDYPLTRTLDGTITLPGNAIKVDVNDEFNYECDAVQRGARLYNAKTHSYAFPRDLKCTLVTLLEWDELPQPVRHYITIRAARTFQARHQGNDASDRFTETDEALALAACSLHEADTGDHNMIRDSYSAASILEGRWETGAY